MRCTTASGAVRHHICHPRWYGWQMALVDAADVGIAVASLHLDIPTATTVAGGALGPTSSAHPYSIPWTGGRAPLRLVAPDANTEAVRSRDLVSMALCKPMMNLKAQLGICGLLIGSITGCGGVTSSTGSHASCTSSSVSGACNDLTDIGSLVNSTCAAGSVPTGTGGVIADGTYVLSAVVGYDCGDAGGPPPQSQTVVISNGCAQGVGHVDGQAISTTQTFIFSGNELTGSIVCPPGRVVGTQTATFTATASSFTFFHPSPFNQVEVYSLH
jgi:hypothetical protein